MGQRECHFSAEEGNCLALLRVHGAKRKKNVKKSLNPLFPLMFEGSLSGGTTKLEQTLEKPKVAFFLSPKKTGIYRILVKCPRSRDKFLMALGIIGDTRKLKILPFLILTLKILLMYHLWNRLYSPKAKKSKFNLTPIFIGP